MNSFYHMKEFIKRVSGQENVLTIPLIYVDLTGDLNTALILNQSIYYTSITKRKDGYFYKTYKEWERETSLTQYQVKKSVDKLKNMEIMQTKLKKANGSPTLHYKIDMSKLQNWIIKKLNNGNQRNLIMDSEETNESLTENYTENYISSSSNAFEFYENNFGMITPFIAERISDWVNTLSEELVIEAMKIALTSNKQFNYAEGILRDWHKRNVKTLSDVQALEKEFKRKKDTGGRLNPSEIDWSDV